MLERRELIEEKGKPARVTVLLQLEFWKNALVPGQAVTELSLSELQVAPLGGLFVCLFVCCAGNRTQNLAPMYSTTRHLYTQASQALCGSSQVTLECSGCRPLLPAPVHSQVLPNGHQKVGRSMFPQTLLCPRCSRSLQFIIPGL